jgi:large subunit ribosomal protein L35Ae
MKEIKPEDVNGRFVEGANMPKLSGVVVSYSRGPRTQKPKECLIQFSGVKSPSEAGQLIGRKVAWPVGKKKCIGKIVSLHGKKGLVKARFRKGIPGNALGSLAEIIG